ncbi:tetratricopeptide repeat protein [bacterium]|nr:tetratricopeptide repeat protein [bacterium]
MQKVLILILVLAFQNAFASTSGKVDEGIKHYKKGNFTEAEKQFQEAIKDDKESGILHFNLGTAKFKNGDYEAAMNEFSRAATDSTLLEKATYNIGNSLLHQGISDTTQSTESLEKSLNYFKNVLKNNPHNENARKNLELAQNLIAIRKKQQQNQQKQDKENPPPPSDEAKKLKEEIEKLIAKHRYLEAWDLTQQAKEKDETFAPNFATFCEIVGELAEVFNQ